MCWLASEPKLVLIECASIPKPPFALLEFTGVERNDFLHRLLSNQLMLSPGQATSAYYLTVQGRPLAQFWVFQGLLSSWLVCADSLAQTSLEELDKMHFGEKLRMYDRSAEWHPTMLLGPGRKAWLAEHYAGPVPGSWGLQESAEHLWCRFPFLASGSDLVWTRTPLLTNLPDRSDSWEVERIQACRPWPSDWGEKTLLLEVAEETDYVDGKGCYPGQEVVARTLHRGHINRHIRYLTGPLPLPARGCKLRREDKDMGWISSAAAEAGQLHCLAFLRQEAWEPGLLLDREDGGQVQVCSPRRQD